VEYNQKEKELSEILGEKAAHELVRLSKNFDNYVLKFKKQMDDILNPHGYEVKTGFVVQPIKKD